MIAGTAAELCYTPGEEPKLLLYMLDRAAAEESMKSLDAEALELLGMEIGAVMSTAEVDEALAKFTKDYFNQVPTASAEDQKNVDKSEIPALPRWQCRPSLRWLTRHCLPRTATPRCRGRTAA